MRFRRPVASTPVFSWAALAAATFLMGAESFARADATTPPGQVDARAASASSSPAERQKLRVELDHVNAEIDALKHETRGLRDDYRLRALMADAEAVARRLTELDARAAGAGGRPAAVAPVVAWPATSEASPSGQSPGPADDPADLEARADILSDRSRRLATQADELSRRVSELRGRQELRRRAGQLERDPFSPLEQARHRIATSGSPTYGQKDTRSVGTTETPAPGPGAGSQPVAPTITAGPGTTGAAPVGAGAAVSQPVPATPSAPTAGRSNDSTSSSSAPSPPTLLPPTAGADSTTSVASQFQGILDATTLGEIRRLELPGSSGGNLRALERAAEGLRARASVLESSATALRQRARAGASTTR